MKEKLQAFKDKYGWLPSIVDLYLSKSFVTADMLREEVNRAVKQLSKVPDDGSCGSLLKVEKAFLREFKYYE